MGEIIKELGTINIKDQNLCVELCASTFEKGKREIHIQNNAFRLAISENEFLRMSASVLHAKKQLEIIKGYDL